MSITNQKSFQEELYSAQKQSNQNNNNPNQSQMGLESVLNHMDTEQEFDTEVEQSNKKQ